MSVWAITMVKDEIDVIERTLRHVEAQGVTGITVLDNGSTDGTYEALCRMHHELNCDLLVIPDPEVAYYQSAKMTMLANQAHANGAEWVWPFDADELWTHDSGTPIAKMLRRMDDCDVLAADLYHFYPTVDDERGHPFDTMVWRDREPAPLPKIIARWRPGMTITQGNHEIQGATRECRLFDLRIRHYPYRSVEQFVRKVRNGGRAYAATDLPPHIGQHWRDMNRMTDAELRAFYDKHFLHKPGLVFDPLS